MPAENLTEAAARKAGIRFWRSQSWPQGLYRKLSNDRFFSRFREPGAPRSFMQLETDNLEIAKRKLRDRTNAVLDVRESDHAKTAGDFRTMGELAAELKRQIETSTRKTCTRKAHLNHLARLQQHWQGGAFDSYQVGRVDLDLIIKTRNYLRTEAPYIHGRNWGEMKEVKRKIGYKPNCVNATLWVFEKLMELAVSKRSRVENPFKTSTTLQGNISLPRDKRCPDLPSCEVMQHLFADMRHVPAAIGVGWAQTRTVMKRRKADANNMADLAELIAYTGCRHEEAVGLTVADIDRNRADALFVNGTKSKSAVRDVPIFDGGVMPLRQLLNRLKAGKGPADRLITCKSALRPLARSCERLGLPVLVQHELRHYFATVMIEAGVSWALLASWLGHADGGITAAQVYGHLRRSHDDSERTRVNAMLKAKGRKVAAKINAGSPVVPFVSPSSSSGPQSKLA